MGTEILKSFGTLQLELEQAKSSLKGVDEHIKRLIGRDPSEIIINRSGPGLKRLQLQNDESRTKQRVLGGSAKRNFNNHENDEPLNKRRTTSSVFKRLSERPGHYEEEIEPKPPRQMISKVIVTPKEIPSRQEALAAQSSDEKSKARNKRMFGALLGTLQKFQQEETKLKPREDKRAQLEKKIEEHEIREKAEIRKERQELFLNRKKKQAEIKMIELKMIRMKEYAIWEERQKPRMNFIQTKAKPHIHYLPRKLNETSKAALETTRSEIEKMIDTKRQEVFDELQHIEERMRKNFEPRKVKDEKPAVDAGEEENNEQREDNAEEIDGLPVVENNALQEDGELTSTTNGNKEEEEANNENENENKNGAAENEVENQECVDDNKIEEDEKIQQKETAVVVVAEMEESFNYDVINSEDNENVSDVQTKEEDED